MNYGYARVSTRGQVDGNSLEEQCNSIKKEYPDAEIVIEQYSGAAQSRPLFDALIDKMQPGDRLIVTKLDRLCRTTKSGLEYIERLRNKNVKIHILNMGLIESSPMGDLIVTCLLAFAQFERSLIIERTQSGKEIARQRPGYKEGRPRKFNKARLDHAMELLKDRSYRQVEEETGISKATLSRYNRKKQAEKLLNT